MATLEKIRSRQKLLFGIVLGALILFILTAVDPSQVRNLFGGGTTIAKVGGVKVDYNEYREFTEKNQNQQQDHEVAAQNAIRALMMQKLLEEELDALGIKVTDSEITRAMTGERPHQAAAQFIMGVSQALGLPTQDGKTLLDALRNPGRYNLQKDQLDALAQHYFQVPTMLDAWAAQEKNVEDAIRQNAFGSLISGLYTANMLDAKSLYTDNNTRVNLSYVTAPYSSVNDADVKVTDEDLRAMWEKNRWRYKIAEETRDVEYIVVPINPSAADMAQAEKSVDEVMSILRGTTTGAIPAYFMADGKNLPMSKIKGDPDLKAIPDSVLHKDAVYRYPKANNIYRIAKVNDITMEIDSINVAVFATQSKAEADSIYNLINSGKATFKSVLADAQGQGGDSLWVAPAQIPGLGKVLESAQIGETAVYNDSVQGANYVYRVLNRHNPVQFVDVTVYKYVLDPSQETVADVKAKLSSFLASNNNEEAFAANAEKAGYKIRTAQISASTPQLGYMPNPYGMSQGVAGSRHAIHWAMNAKEGQVSPILEDNQDSYIVVAVKGIYEDQYLPYTSTDVKEELTAMVKADKKGDILVKKYDGKARDLAGYAQLMGAEVQTDSTFVFSAPGIAGLPGAQYLVQGRVAAAAPGKVSGPVKGANEVVVFVVNGSNTEARPFNFDQDSQAYMNMFGIKDPFTLLLGNRKMQNLSLDFENYDKK